MRSIITSASSIALATLLVIACGADDKKVVAPGPDAAAGTPVQTVAGAVDDVGRVHVDNA